MAINAEQGIQALPVVGVDLMRVAEVSWSLARHGEAYLNRVYTAGEIAYARTSETDMERRLAARFAAKEAALKVLRPEGRWFDWRLLEVTRNAHGHCELLLHGAAARLATERGMQSWALSLSHEGDLAVAVVVGQRADNSAACAREFADNNR